MGKYNHYIYTKYPHRVLYYNKQPNVFDRDPTPKNILGVHWDMTKNGEILHYLAINRTENSTTLWNYRQRECAFWTEYLPSVIGYITPTYPPTTEVCQVALKQTSVK